MPTYLYRTTTTTVIDNYPYRHDNDDYYYNCSCCCCYLRYLQADAELAQDGGGGVLFFCVRGKHRSAAAVTGYIVRCTELTADEANAKGNAE